MAPTDPLAAFEDLKDWPGKRPPVNRTAPEPEGEQWDGRPRSYKVNGVDTPFYTIGDLAVAVNRTPRTIRHWERIGVIPPATFRSQKPHKSALKAVGDRLYSHAQVLVVIAAAAATGVLDGKPPTPDFTTRIVKGWVALQRGS